MIHRCTANDRVVYLTRENNNNISNTSLEFDSQNVVMAVGYIYVLPRIDIEIFQAVQGVFERCNLSAGLHTWLHSSPTCGGSEHDFAGTTNVLSH